MVPSLEVNVLLCWISPRSPSTCFRVPRPTARLLFRFRIPIYEGDDRRPGCVISPAVVDTVSISDDDASAPKGKRNNFYLTAVFENLLHSSVSLRISIIANSLFGHQSLPAYLSL